MADEQEGLLVNAKTDESMNESESNNDDVSGVNDSDTNNVDTNDSNTNENISNTPPDGSPPVDVPVRPDYVPENFWDSKKGEVNIEALSKSYSELRKAFNKKNNDKAGETIDDYFDEKYFDEDGKFKSEKISLDKEDPSLKAVYEVAKESGMGIKQTNDFINNYINKVSDLLPQPINTEEEIKKLGNNGEKVVSGIKVWIDGMLKNGEVTEDVYSEILALGKTAAGIKALDVLRQKSGELSLPIGEALSGSTHMTLDDWYSATYETHAEPGESRQAFQERMHELGKKLIGTGHGTYSGSGKGIKPKYY